MTVIEQGMKLTGRQIDYLPPTSRVALNNTKYLRKQNGRWMQVGFPTNNWTWRDFIGDGGAARVEFIPVPVELPDSLVETFDAWEARFLRAVRQGAENNGVRNETINRAFRDIGLDIDRTVEGPRNPGDMTYGSAGMQRAPEGTIVSVVSSGMVYKRVGSYWRRQTPSPESRDRNLPTEALMLVRWGTNGPTELVEPVITDDERMRLSQTKARAWKVAMRMKSQHGWCSTLESIVNSGGVFATDAMGDGVDKETQRSNPEGTLFFWFDANTSEWAILRRDHRARNQAGTVRVMGSSSANTGPYVDLIQRPGGAFEPPTWVAENTSQEVRHLALPEYAGTRFGADTSRYIVCRDGTIAPDPGATGIVPDHGQWNASSFGVGRTTMRIETLVIAS